jgi:uncharacterized membrane protein YgcG
VNLNIFGYDSNTLVEDFSMKLPLLIHSLLLVAALCFASQTICAAPAYIQDNAKVVSEDMASKLEKELASIEEKDRFHLEVVVIPNFYGRQPAAVVDAFNQQLAKNAPDISKRALLLIEIENGIVVIRPSPDIESAYDANSVKDITANVKLKLNDKNYDEAVRIGVAGMYHFYQKKFPSTAQVAPVNTTKVLFNIILFVIVLIGVVFLIQKMVKKQPEK